MSAETHEAGLQEEGADKFADASPVTQGGGAHLSPSQIADILERMTDCFVALDREWRYTYLNRRAEELLGAERGELIGRSIWEAFPQLVGTTFEAECRRALAEESPSHFEEHYPWLDVWIEADVYPDAEGLSVYFQDVTTRKRAEDRLQQDIRLYSTLVHSIGGIVWESDPQTFQFTFVSKWAEQILGYPVEQWLDDPNFWRDHTHPDDVEWCTDYCLSTTAREQDHDFEYRMFAADGRVVWLHDIVTVRRGDDGSLQLRGIMLDITARKQEKEALERSERRLRLIFETEPECVKLLAADGVVLDMNPAGLAMIEADSLTQVQGRSVNGLLVPEHRPAFLSLAERVFRGETGTLEFEIVSLKGKRLWLETHAAPLYEGNTVAALLAVSRDVTERKRMEEALRQSEERYRQLLDTTQEGVWITDPESRTTYVNPRMAEMIGYTVEEMLGRPIYDFVDEELRADAERHHRQRRDGAREQFDFRLRRKDGSEAWVIIAASPFYNELGEFVGELGMITDLTERKSLEEQLMQAQKMEAVGRLAGGVAHDFNNLLTAILGYSQALLRRLPQDDPMRRQVGEIERAGMRAAELTRQLLAFSRKQVMQPKVLDLNVVIAESVRMIRRLIGEDIELIIDFAPEPGRIKTDPGQMEQIVVNLAVNARDAMPRGGRLVIRTSSAALSAEEARLYGDIGPGQYVKLTVSDTGAGMSEEVRARIFEPFFTTKEHGKGTGLGLSTVYGIVKQSGGDIRVTSAPGAGATFEIIFPRVRETPAVEQKAPDALCETPGTETILLVEDEQMVRSLAREFLEMSGYTVLEADDGIRALSLAAAHDGPIHLLLTDVVMPQMSGRELAEQLKQTRHETRVLYISGYTDDAIVHHGMLDDDVDFLQKPFTLEALALSVRASLER